jgi:hypothetical protein
MGKDLNISVLVAARNEYIEQLKYVLIPLIIQGFNSIYSDALTISKGKHVILKFQDLLEGIMQWNQTILQEEAKRIKRKCPYIMDIVTAIFVSSVKILASVRLGGKNDNINIKIPTSDIFIHSIYVEAGDQIWNDPFLFYHKNHPKKPPVQICKSSVIAIIADSIDRSFRQMLPLDDILQEYLANALNGSDSESESEGSEPEGSEELNGNDIMGSDEDSAEDIYSNDSDNEPETDEPKTFNFSNPPGEQYIPPQPQQVAPAPAPAPFDQYPPQPQQATTFDQLNSVNNVERRSSYSSSGSSGSSRSSSSSGSSRSSSSSSGSDRSRKHRKHKHSFF